MAEYGLNGLKQAITGSRSGGGDLGHLGLSTSVTSVMEVGDGHDLGLRLDHVQINN